ncbi:uncharacterized protein LOC141623246 isoform X2 [Silene latifolia]|uniref:uncharacterized protein LOC141623246 isoform X2 n=1 Tax=Silene latifolia TaxID=37657 RepID=UPI003D785D72
MATDSREQEYCHILVLTEEATGANTAQFGSQLEGPTVDMDISDSFPPFVVKVDIEQGSTDVLETNRDTCGNIKTDIALTKPLRRQNSFQMGLGREPIQPLMNHILMLLKFDAKEKQGLERGHENRGRKCKRPSLFDSRHVVILFSILSSMGTLVLIYLTLRVRQVGYIHG